MKLCSKFSFVLFIVLATVAVAQNTVPQSTEEGPMPVLEKQSLPAHLGNEAPDLAIDSDLETGNVLVVGAMVGAAYDNRGLYHSGATPSYSGDTRYFIQPSIGIQRRFSTGDWTLSYTPGASFSQHNWNDTQYTQNFAGDINLKPSAYLLVHARQDFSLTDNPFETVGRVDLLPGLGGAFGPNYNGVLPQTRRTSLVSDADVTYRMAEHTAIGITAGYQKYDYDAVRSSDTTLLRFVNSQVITGSAFFSQQFSAAVTAGVQVAWVDVYSTGAQVSRTQAPSAMLFFKVSPNPHLSFTFYGGPEYARTRDVVPSGALGPIVEYQRSWYPNVGGTLVWSSGRHAIDVQGMRRIANGGGLMDAVQATYAGAGYRARLSRNLLANVRTDWSDQNGIGALSSNSNFRSLWAGGGPVVELSRSLEVRCDVAYVNQSAMGLSSGPGNHFLVQGSLYYRFHKNLGD